MAGVNDGLDQADALAGIALRLGAHVNLIALNPTPLAPYDAPAKGAVRQFAAHLRKLGVNATVRDTRGRTIDAACGQLRAKAAT